MKEFNSDQEAFDKICGSCDGIDINDITEDDIKSQGAAFECSDEMIEAAIRALKEMQNG